MIKRAHENSYCKEQLSSVFNVVRKKEGNIKKDKNEAQVRESKQDPEVELNAETLLSSELGDERKP